MQAQNYQQFAYGGPQAVQGQPMAAQYGGGYGQQAQSPQFSMQQQGDRGEDRSMTTIIVVGLVILLVFVCICFIFGMFIMNKNVSRKEPSGPIRPHHETAASRGPRPQHRHPHHPPHPSGGGRPAGQYYHRAGPTGQPQCQSNAMFSAPPPQCPPSVFAPVQTPCNVSPMLVPGMQPVQAVQHPVQAVQHPVQAVQPAVIAHGTVYPTAQQRLGGQHIMI